MAAVRPLRPGDRLHNLHDSRAPVGTVATVMHVEWRQSGARTQAGLVRIETLTVPPELLVIDWGAGRWRPTETDGETPTGITWSTP